MLRDQVAPALRALGLKGSGTSYLVPSDEYWALVGFQGHRRNDAQLVRFTVNLSVVAREVWARAHESFPAMLAARPAANVVPSLLAEADRGRYWWARIGVVMPAALDRWWQVAAARDTSDTAREVVEAIRDYGLPAIREHIARGV